MTQKLKQIKTFFRTTGLLKQENELERHTRFLNGITEFQSTGQAERNIYNHDSVRIKLKVYEDKIKCLRGLSKLLENQNKAFHSEHRQMTNKFLKTSTEHSILQEKYATLKKIIETLYDLVEKEFPMLENKIEKLNQKVQEGIQKTELSERTITKTYSSLRKQLNVVSAKIDDRDNAASSFAESAIDDTYATLLKFFF